MKLLSIQMVAMLAASSFEATRAAKPAENHATAATCADRTMNECEKLDDTCIKAKNQCLEVNRGAGVQGDPCQVTLETDDKGHPVYTEVEGKGCTSEFICSFDDGTSFGATEIDGTCQPTACFGKKVAANCQDNGANKDQCDESTERVTICHRTCAENNPWVRITIDKDAWLDHGSVCAHPQHSIANCNGKDPSFWGSHTQDYLIKDHGRRKDLVFQTPNAERDYWKIWERACPSVRNGECCSWDPAAENPCCGDPPTPSGDDDDDDDEDCPSEQLYAIGNVKTEQGDLGNFASVDDFPVEVLSTDGTTVTFQVCNKLGAGRVFTGFEGDGTGYKCYESDTECETYSALCMETEPIAIVDIYLTEPQIDDAKETEVPQCCHDDDVNPKAASYVFVLRCDCATGIM